MRLTLMMIGLAVVAFFLTVGLRAFFSARKQPRSTNNE